MFNCKPCFEYLDVTNFYFTKADIKESVFDNDQDDLLIVENKEEQ